MKSQLLLIAALAGCATVYRQPRGDDLAEVGFTTRIARSELAHGTKIEIRRDEDRHWEKIESQSDIKVAPGVHHFRFVGTWRDVPEQPPRRDQCVGCGFTLGGAFGLVGVVVAAAIVGSSSRRTVAGEVIADCTVDLTLEIAPEEDIELTFRHDDEDRCDVLCATYDDSGRHPCEIIPHDL